MLQRGFDHALHIVIIAAALINAFFAFSKRQHVAFFICQSQLIDVFRKGQCHAIGICLVFLTQVAAGVAHVPFIGFIRHIQIGDGAPAHAALHSIAFCHDRPDGFQIGIIQCAVACSANQGTLGAATAHAQGENAVHIAGKQIRVVTCVPDGGFKIGHSGRSPVIPATGSGKNHNHAGVRIIRNAAVAHGAAVACRRGHGRIAGRIHWQDQRRGDSGILPDGTRFIHGAGIGSIAVV